MEVPLYVISHTVVARYGAGGTQLSYMPMLPVTWARNLTASPHILPGLQSSVQPFQLTWNIVRKIHCGTTASGTTASCISHY